MTKKTEEKTEENTKTNTPLPVQKWRNKLFEHEYKHFVCKAHPKATTKDLERFDYWKNAGASLSRHDRITVLADDESWEAECIVERAATGKGADVRVVRVTERTSINLAVQHLDDDHFLQFRGGKGFCVIRKKDEYPVISGHATEEACRHQFFREQPRQAV